MMTTFHGVKPNQQICILKKKILEGLVTHGEIYGKSHHLVPFKTEELHILDMFFFSATADYNMGAYT